MNNNNNSLGIIAMAAGIVSLVLAVVGLGVGCCYRGGGWMALIAIILGVVGIALGASAKKKGGSGTAGLVTGIIGLIFAVIVGFSCIICNACGYYKAYDIASSSYDDLEDAIDDLEDLEDLF